MWTRKNWKVRLRFGLGLLVGAALSLFAAAPARADTIAGAEYFFDVDPGEGNGTSLPAADGAFNSSEESVDLSVAVPANLKIGPHTLYVRFRSASGAWGLARPLLNDSSYLAPYNFRVSGAKWIAAAEYFFDIDPGEGLGTPAAAADGAFDSAEEEVLLTGLDVSALAPGVHKVFIRFKDSEGTWGPARQTTFQTFGLSAAEYYVDADPGKGKASVLAASDGAFNSGIEEAQADGVSTVALSEGRHLVYARFRDDFGLWGSPVSVPAEVIKDTIPPVVAVTAPANGSLTNNKTPAVSYTVTDANPTTCTAKVDTGAEVPWTSGQPLGALADGDHTVTVTCTDAAGNKGVPATTTFTVDTIPPAVSVSSPVHGSYTNITAPVLAYSFSDVHVTTCSTKVDGATVATSSGQALSALPDGSHTVAVTCTDAAGNAGAASSTFTVDTIPPATSVSGTPSNPTNQRGASLTVGGADVVAYKYRVDAGAWSAETPVATQITLGGLTEGAHTVAVVGRDLAGNWQLVASATSATWTVDVTPPVVGISAPANGSQTNNKTPTLSFNQGDGVAVVVKVDGSVVAKTSGQALDALSDGAHTVVVESFDAAGNVGTASVTFTVDTIPPVASISSPPASPTYQTTASFTVGGAGVVAYAYRLDGGGWSSETPVATPIALSGLGVGAHQVCVVGRDTAGNWQSQAAPTCGGSWTVELGSTVHWKGQILATPNWADYRGKLTINGADAQAGDEVAVFDPQGVLCGHYLVTTSGVYGYVHVYGDDPTTAIDEGANPGDWLTFKAWSAAEQKEYLLAGKVVSGSLTWEAMGTSEVDLSTSEHFALPLQAGWNLISFPLALCVNVGSAPTAPLATGVQCETVTSVGSLFSSIAGKYSMVRSFDVDGAHTYDPGVPEYFNDLAYVAGGYGYWIKMKEAATLALDGLPLGAAAELTLRAGWNLAGYWADSCQYTAADPPAWPVQFPEGTSFVKVAKTSDVLWTLGNSLQLVKGFDATGAHIYDPKVPEAFNDLTYLAPGYGYWIKITEAANLAY